MPYGETWIDEVSNKNVIDYKFTGKEYDPETGLYYFGARYLDPILSRWISTDPAIEDYMPVAPVDKEARKKNKSLPGQGGVFNPINMSLYRYSGNNPIKYVDPDGEKHLKLPDGYHYFTNLNLKVYPVKTIKNEVTGTKTTFYHLTKEKALTGEKIYGKTLTGDIYFSIEGLAKLDSELTVKNEFKTLGKFSLSIIADASFTTGALNNGLFKSLVPDDPQSMANFGLGLAESEPSNFGEFGLNIGLSLLPFSQTIKYGKELEMYGEKDKFQHFRLLEYDEDNNDIILK